MNIILNKCRFKNDTYYNYYLNHNLVKVFLFNRNSFYDVDISIFGNNALKFSNIKNKEYFLFKKYLVNSRILPIFISYFAYYKDNSGVSIANSQPKNCDYKIYKPLVPDWKLVTKFKSDGDIDYFTKNYINTTLKNLDPVKVYNDLNCKVLLCWEHPKDFCHRQIVAKWLNKKLGINVTGYKKINKQNSLWK